MALNLGRSDGLPDARHFSLSLGGRGMAAPATRDQTVFAYAFGADEKTAVDAPDQKKGGTRAKQAVFQTDDTEGMVR